MPPAFAILFTALAASTPPATPAAGAEVVAQAHRIIEQRCLSCHGPAKRSGGLRLDQREPTLLGGVTGPALKPGHPTQSLLIELVRSTQDDQRMPPKGTPLTQAEVVALEAWVREGAPWPAQPLVDPSQDRKRLIDTHWAFRALPSPAQPEPAASTVHPIDALVLEQLTRSDSGLNPAPRADPHQLARRLSLDLTGLPPTPQELEDFLADPSEAGYRRAVERLLASPRFGEKWAMHWLDQARYADSDGFEKDRERPDAWRYRHWVIDAINRDLPFDRFTLEQLAGDLIPDAGLEARVATGYLRGSLANRENGTDPQHNRHHQVADRAHAVASAWLALSLECARCHDHPHDPLTQRDYYRFLAFFDHSEDLTLEAPLPGDASTPDTQSQYEAQLAALLTEHDAPKFIQAWEDKVRYTTKNYGEHNGWDNHWLRIRIYIDNAERILFSPPSQRSASERDEFLRFCLEEAGALYPEPYWAPLRPKELLEKLRALQQKFPPPSRALVVRELPGQASTPMRKRGDFYSPGAKVDAGLPEAFVPETRASMNRLDLARWLTSPDHALAARVAVNRIWQELMGQPLVATGEDFGVKGDPPTHPALLDHLARQFISLGFSRKALIRHILLSRTYQQASTLNPHALAADPRNRLLARQRRVRLPGELIRDGALFAAGVLDGRIGGRSVFPPQPRDMSELTTFGDRAWPESTGADQYRRGLYIHFQRTAPYPLLTNFDAPSRNLACSRRGEATSPLQALNLLNDPVFTEAARLLGRRLATAPGTDERRLHEGFLLCLSRPPESEESSRLLAFLESQRRRLREEPTAAISLGRLAPQTELRADYAAWTLVARVLLNLEEFITRE